MAVNVIHGTSGDDNLTGTGGDDTFQLGLGGNDHAQGLGGNDIFNFAGTLTAADTIDGGTGNDLVRLNGDYSAGITLGAATLTSVETLQMLEGFSYKLTTVDGNVAAGQTLAVDAGTLSAGHTLTFDGSAETDGSFRFTGGAGNDDLTGGAGADSFHLEHGGEDTAHGGGGNDIFIMGASFDAGDRLDGGVDSGAASNVLRLDGDYSAGVTLGANTIANIDTLQFEAGHDYKIVADAQSFLSGPTVAAQAGQLGAGDTLTLDVSASDANFHVFAGAGDDVLTGGGGFNIFDLSKGGTDTATGGDSRDIFRFGGTLDASDHIDGGAGTDTVDMAGMGGSDALVFGATTFTGVDILYLADGFDYDLETVNANVAAGATLLVDGSSVGAGHAVDFNGTAETDGHFTFRGGAGNDVFDGGALADTVNFTKGGNDTTLAGGGDDIINMGGTFDASDHIDGGSGNDTLSLDGTYATPITVSGTMVQNVETVTLAGDGYNIAWQSAIGAGLTVDASAIGRGVSVIFDSSALATGDVHLIAGAGQTSFTGGGGDDVVDLQNSGDGYRVSAGDGDDTVNFGAQFGTGLPFLDLADGNGGSNTATFDGDYSGGLTLGVQSFIVLSYGLTDFQTIKLLGDHSYTVTFDDSQVPGATLTGGAALTVDASALGAGDHAALDFSLSAAPGFTVTGSAGDDTITFAANFAAGDAIDGGAGNDTLELNGDYSGGLTFGAATLTSVETLKLDDGFSYKLTTNNGNVATGATLTVDASALTGANALTFDGSAENGGFFAITGGAGADSVTFGSKFSVSDSINGGAGSDTLTLNNLKGTYNFTATTMTNVETLAIANDLNNNIAITTTDANVAAGATLTVDFSPINNGLNTAFDGSAEQDGHFAFIAPGISNGVVTLTGGALSDSFALLGGDSAISNLFNGGGGDDTLHTIALASRVDFDGGTGNDTVALTGGGTETDTRLVLTSVENMTLDDNGWNVTMGNTAAGDTLNVNATALSGSHTLTFDGSEITNGARFVFSFAGNFVTGDSLTGGAGSDTLSLNGDYTSPLVMGASTISAIETITVADGHSYDIVSNNANVASGATLTVDSSALTGGNTLSFSGSAELDGHFAFIGGAGADVLEGGSQSDTFDLGLSDGAFVNGGGGSDTFTVTSRAFLLDDFIDGSAGSDTLVLNGNFSTATALTGSNIEDIDALTLLGAANSYNLAFTDGITTSLTVNASAAASLTFDATGDTATAFTITGSAGNDALTGGGLNDGFNLTGGGNDTAHGGAGNDTFSFGGAFTAADTVDGGANSDTISLNGDYSTALTLGAATLTSVENIVMQAGHSYDLITNDANVASGQTLTVTASSLGAGDTLTVDGTAESDGHFAFTGGAGNDTLTGGAQSDTFDLTKGGTDTVHGGGGSDTITIGNAFTAADNIDGGTGSDTVKLVNITGTYAFTATTIQNVEDLVVTVTDGRDASFTTNDANVAAGATMIVDFSSTGPIIGSGNLTFDGSAETDGHFAFVEPDNILNMTLTGGALSDTLSFTHGDAANSNNFNGLGGDDTVTTTGNASSVKFDGGMGNDTLAFTGGGTESRVDGLISVETVTFDDNDWNVAQRFVTTAASLNVDATALSGGHTLTFNGVDTTDGPGFADESFVFEFAGNFIAGDSLTGNTGNDTLSLNGNYSGGFTFGANTISSIETIAVAAGHSYDLVTNDANVAAGATLTVDGSALLAGTTLDFNGSAELDGHFAFISGAGADDLQGGAQSDTFDLSRTATANAFGNGGNDSFTVTAAAMIANGFIDGGAGSDTLILNGDFSTQTQITASTVTNIETLQLLGAANSYNLAIGGGVGFAAILTIDASAASSLTLDTSGGGTTDYAITGSANADSITFTSRTVLLGSTIDGGAGSDTLILNGNFGTTSTLTATTFTNVEKIVFGVQATNYGFVSNDANIASGKTLTLDGTALTHALNWDGSAETDGFFAFTGGAGNDTFTIGGASVLAGSTIDGGTGSQNNFLVLNGDYSAAFTFTAAEMSNIQNLTLGRNHSYHLTTVDANVAAGSHLSLNGLALVSTDTIYFNGSAETDGLFTLEGGQGADTLIGGAGNDTFFGYIGADTMTGGAGVDTFTYTFAVGSGVSESTSTGYDTITDINFSVDRIDPPGANGTVTGVDAAIVGGALSTASFDADLAAAVNSGTLAVAHAVLFTANSGTLSGHTFLVVDENGTAGYQASADLVIDVTGYTGTLTTGSFV